MCGEGGGGDEAISKLKGAGAKHALPRSYLHLFCCFVVVVVVALLFYVHSKHLRSCRDGQLT